MEYSGTVEVTITTGDSSVTEVFENESLSISRSSKLGIINKNKTESELFNVLKAWYEQDKKSKVQSYLIIKTSEQSAIESFRKYYFEKIVEESDMIIFNWVGNHSI